ncbi:hypothetical protein [Methanohalophilus sp. WG1-DM]|uniref:hypothetical protein n=1 Tax=Methanohalophilus sp. WG1-DM TaxID=2491675 RepID=UPI000FFF39B9|nr:hypothetical protein [Methanohalophilus sp. WG1-DM]RXG35217.1 hypothetical protein CI957_241 [Methanohalophilus sp. WG1-DM]
MSDYMPTPSNEPKQIKKKEEEPGETADEEIDDWCELVSGDEQEATETDREMKEWCKGTTSKKEEE